MEFSSGTAPRENGKLRYAIRIYLHRDSRPQALEVHWVKMRPTRRRASLLAFLPRITCIPRPLAQCLRRSPPERSHSPILEIGIEVCRNMSASSERLKRERQKVRFERWKGCWFWGNFCPEGSRAWTIER